jgi:hypothetical protein
MKNIVKGALVATAVAGMMVAVGCGTPTDTNEDALGKCVGGNACKGQGACEGKDKDGKEHTCAGNNACKGQGWTKTKKADCTDGTWEALPAK